MKVTKAPLGVTFDADEIDLFQLDAEITERTIENYLQGWINSILDAALSNVLESAQDEETRQQDKTRFATVEARVAKWHDEDFARVRAVRAAD